MKSIKNLSWLSGIVFVVLALLISACSNSDGSTNTGAAQGTTSTTTGTVKVVNSTTAAPTPATSTTMSDNRNTTILPTLPLTQIRMTDASHGWALDKNNVLKTSDGGKSWVALTPKGADVSHGIEADFMNALNAWVAMPGNSTITLFRTTTGGASWTSSSINEATPGGLSLTFVSSQTGWIEDAPDGAGAGSEGVDILRTDNGGATWTRIATSGQGANALPIGGIKSGLSFVNTATGWATGESATMTPWLYMTHDGGKTWYPKTISGLSSAASAYQTAPSEVLGNNGFLPLTVTNSSTPHTILARSSDGGATWTVNGQQSAAFLTSNLYVENSQNAWATDQNSGDVYRTTNGGKTWQKVASQTGIYGPLSFISATTGFGLSGRDQTLLKRTDDGGKTWQTISYQLHG